MALNSVTVDLLALAAFSLLVIKFEQRRRRKGLPYPPGPPAFPLVGNLLDMPKESSWLAYTDWGKVYGDIMSVQVFGQALVVLNSAKVARDLLEKRSSIYSARPSIPFYELMKWTWYILTNSSTAPGWRLGRKMLDRGLRPNAVVQYRPMQKLKVHDFLKQLLSHPQDYKHHIEHLQGAIIMSVVYGYDIKSTNDTYLRTALDANIIGQTTLLPGTILVNDLPFLKYFPGWLPGMGFQALAKEGEKLGNDMVDRPFQLVKDSMRQGTARLSVTQANLLELEKTDAAESEQAERAIAEASGSLYLAGADSTVSAILTLFLALILHPDVMRKAQAELDAVTGGQRLPDYEDRARLPYVEAICKEVLRWRMVAPAGVPHAATQDDVYEGYFIPKGSIVIANLWAILHDPRVYQDPDEFMPERFLTASGEPRDDPNLAAVFGFGKRICPGRHIAENTLFIVTASFLATYSIGKAKDAHGNEIPVGRKYTGGVISFPEKFECSIVPRPGKAEELIAAESWGA